MFNNSKTDLTFFFFTSASAALIILVGWFLTDRVIEPRLKQTQVDGDPANLPKLDALTDAERKGLRYATLSMLVSSLLS